jgi:tryptophan-rich sensory protein
MGDWETLLIAVGTPEILGALVGILTSHNIKTWYNNLKKPSFCPPDWIFGVVWPVLYALIGVASYLIYEDGGFQAQLLPLAVYISNLAVNNLWSVVFFGAHQIFLAFLDILLVDGTAIAAFVLFYPVNKVAAYLLVPYIVWVSFASALNFAIWRLNPGSTLKATKL